MEMKNFTLLLIISTFISCNSLYKIKDIPSNIEKKTFENPILIYNNDIYPSKKYVGKFNIMDAKKEWKEVRDILGKMAIDNFANGILIEDFRLNSVSTNGREKKGVIVKGKLFQLNQEEVNKSQKQSKRRKIVFFRDELGSILTSNFSTKLTINSNTKKLQDKSFIIVELESNQMYLSIELNGKTKKLKLTEGDNYFWVSRQMNQNQSNGNGINISLGGVDISKINNVETGKILVSLLK
jgi:hypothetical protein